MTYKKIFAIGFIAILLTSTIPIVDADMSTTPFPKPPRLREDIEKRVISTLDNIDKNQTVFITIGPNSRFISNIKILQGSFHDKIRIKLLLRKHLLPRFLPIRILKTEGNITFEITYKRDIPIPTSPLSYLTAYGKTDLNFTNLTELMKNLNHSYYNVKHHLKIKNFKGSFIVVVPPFKRGLFLINPAKVIIIGQCEKVKKL